MRSAPEQVEIACEVRAETEKAYLIYDGAKTVWVPKSQITDESLNFAGRPESIFIPVWLAKDKGLI